MSVIIGKNCYIARSATLIGDVTLGNNVAIMEGAVLRGDINSIVIGTYSNVQDNVTIHSEVDSPTKIGEYVSIGHNAVVHGTTIGDYVIVGMGALVLTGSRIGEGTVIAAGAVIREGFVVPPNSLVAGVPGAVKRSDDPNLREYAEVNAMSYSTLRENYLSGKYEIYRGEETRK